MNEQTQTNTTMDGQMQEHDQNVTDQNVNDQGNSNPPPPQWFQAFTQQMAAHMTYITQRMDRMEQQAQEQPQVHPPPPPTATPITTPGSVPTPASTSALEEELRRPRAKLPDVPLFTGKHSEWRPWKNRIRPGFEMLK